MVRSFDTPPAPTLLSAPAIVVSEIEAPAPVAFPFAVFVSPLSLALFVLAPIVVILRALVPPLVSLEPPVVALLCDSRSRREFFELFRALPAIYYRRLIQ